MQPKYCLPIIKSTFDDVLAVLESHADFAKFEIWLDYFEAEAGPLRQLAKTYPDQLVFHFRRQNLEPIRTPLQKRLDLLKALRGSGAFIDLDAVSQRAEFDYVASEKLDLTIIGSYHNYESTPSDADLHDIVSRITSLRPAVVKLAAYCNEDSDALRLLQLQQDLKTHQYRHIVLGMGPHGVATRIFGTLWGNELAFVPDSPDGASAPGQLTKAELDAIFSNLGL